MSIYIHVGVQVVYPMSNMWIGPWAISPQYMDPTFQGITKYYYHI